jgi:hypothetical protein
MPDIGKNEPISSESIGGASRCGAPGEGGDELGVKP